MSSPADVLARVFDVRGVRAVVTGAASGLGYTMTDLPGTARTGPVRSPA